MSAGNTPAARTQAEVAAEALLAGNGSHMIAVERLRQVMVERWSATHDDEHTDHSLALAACAYAAPVLLYVYGKEPNGFSFADCWPTSWAAEYDKRPRDEECEPMPAWQQSTDQRIRCLVKAGALIAAEIDRILRRHNKGKA